MGSLSDVFPYFVKKNTIECGENICYDTEQHGIIKAK